MRDRERQRETQIERWREKKRETKIETGDGERRREGGKGGKRARAKEWDSYRLIKRNP